jgi:deoxyuridine 5'-triphosphate nucleotidohydrolase
MPYLAYKRLHPAAIDPTYGSGGAIGLDLSALVVDQHDTPYRARIEPGERVAICTGLAFDIPRGYYGRVAPRSGLAVSKGLDVMAGVIDSDFRGEVKVILINHGKFAVSIGSGERIAQLILERADRLSAVEVKALETTDRGEAGFGSTGV